MIGVYLNKIMHIAYEASKEEDVKTVINLINSQVKWVYKIDKLGLDENGKEIKQRHYYANIAAALDTEATNFFIDNDGRQYTVKEVADILDEVYYKTYKEVLNEKKSKKKARTKAKIEVTRAKWYFKPMATMYVWQMAFNDIVITGRTWQEFIDFLASLKEYFGLDKYKEFIFYVHNLKYDHSFFKLYFTWSELRSLVTKKITYYVDSENLIYINDNGEKAEVDFSGFLFRDSLPLAGVRLERLPEIMKNATIQKQVGKLDITKIRHSKTEITQEEWQYIIADVLLLSEYIQEKMAEYHYNVVNIPMTATNENRNNLRNLLYYTNQRCRCKKDDKYKDYINFMQIMKPDMDTYLQVKRALQGGYNHLNAIHANKIYENCIYEIDVKSEYPAILFCELFPITPYIKIEVNTFEDIDYYLENKSCLFDVTLYDVKPRISKDGLHYDLVDSIIPTYKLDEIGVKNKDAAPVYPPDGGEDYSKLWYINKGRLRYAKRITITVDEVEWKNICKFYSFNTDKIHINNFRIAEKGHLPKGIIEYILELYREKEELSEYEDTDTPEGLRYKLVKRALNSMAGMLATDPIRDKFTLDEDGKVIEISNTKIEDGKRVKLSDEEYLDKQKAELDEKKSFLCYQWGCVMLSYGRSYLYQAMEAAARVRDKDGKFTYGNVYGDTDGLKCKLDTDKEYYQMKNFVDTFNSKMDAKKLETLKRYKFVTEMEGVGIIGYENYTFLDKLGHFCWKNKGKPFKKYCSVGGKKYLLEGEKGTEITVSGLAKNSIHYLLDKYGDNLFEVFSKEEIEVDREHSGSSTALYQEEHIEGELKDYNDVVAHFEEESYVHIENTPFYMGDDEDYKHLIGLLVNEWGGL